jgi:FdhE protein
MKHADEAVSQKESIIANAIERYPHAREVLDAFKPIILESSRLLNTLALPKAEYGKTDKIRLQGGVPVIEQCLLFQSGDPAESIALSLIPAIGEGMPKLTAKLAKLEKHIKNGELKLAEAFHTHPSQSQEDIKRWAEAFHIQPAVINLLLRYVTMIILQKRAGEIAGFLGEFVWDKGYCPICSSFPAIAVLKDKSGRRWLHCLTCSHEWSFSRIACPYCENEAPAGMDFFFVDDRKQESAFVCDKCKKYLITLNRSDDFTDYDIEITAIALIHLDMIMQGKGFQPMANCIWNVFNENGC